MLRAACSRGAQHRVPRPPSHPHDGFYGPFFMDFGVPVAQKLAGLRAVEINKPRAAATESSRNWPSWESCSLWDGLGTTPRQSDLEVMGTSGKGQASAFTC